MPIRQKIHYYPNSNQRPGNPGGVARQSPKPPENRSSITVRKASWGSPVPGLRMALRKRGLIAAGLILLLIGGYTLFNYNPVHAYQSTFNLLPGKFFKIGANLRDQTRITGSFQETAGRPIAFMVMSSAQFAAYQARMGTASLYSLPETATGQVDFTSSVPDTYYMLFLHGTGYLNVTQTVNFQRTYTSVDVLAIAAGAALLVLGAVEVYWGFRPSGNRTEAPPATAGDLPPPPWP